MQKKVSQDPERGKRIRQLRGVLNQSEFASMLGIDTSMISRYEKGMKPGVDVLVKMAELYHTTVSRILTGKDAKEQVSEIPEESISANPPVVQSAGNSREQQQTYSTHRGIGDGDLMTRALEVLTCEYPGLRSALSQNIIEFREALEDRRKVGKTPGDTLPAGELAAQGGAAKRT